MKIFISFSSQKDCDRKLDVLHYNMSVISILPSHRFSFYYYLQGQEFTPPYGTPTCLRITSIISTKDIIEMLMAKYKVKNKSDKMEGGGMGRKEIAKRMGGEGKGRKREMGEGKTEVKMRPERSSNMAYGTSKMAGE